jgi:hypothetical protein
MKDLIIKILSVATFIVTAIMAVIFWCLMCIGLAGSDFILFGETACFAAFFMYFSWVDYKYFFVDEGTDEQ